MALLSTDVFAMKRLFFATANIVGIYAGEYGSASHPSLKNCLKNRPSP